jgi:hypothetical protein
LNHSKQLTYTILVESILIPKDKCKELIEMMVNMIFFVVLFFLMLLHLALILSDKRKDMSFIHKKELAVCAANNRMVAE